MLVSIALLCLNCILRLERIASIDDGLQFGLKHVGSFMRLERPEVLQIVFRCRISGLKIRPPIMAKCS